MAPFDTTQTRAIFTKATPNQQEIGFKPLKILVWGRVSDNYDTEMDKPMGFTNWPPQKKMITKKEPCTLTNSMFLKGRSSSKPSLFKDPYEFFKGVPFLWYSKKLGIPKRLVASWKDHEKSSGWKFPTFPGFLQISQYRKYVSYSFDNFHYGLLTHQIHMYIYTVYIHNVHIFQYTCIYGFVYSYTHILCVYTKTLYILSWFTTAFKLFLWNPSPFASIPPAKL